MSYIITHLMGDTKRDPPLNALELLFEELESADDEHTDVSVSHESEWTLSAFKSGHLVWENVAEGDQPRHMRPISREKVLELWRLLAEGRISEIEKEPWQPGYR